MAELREVAAVLKASVLRGEGKEELCPRNTRITRKADFHARTFRVIRVIRGQIIYSATRAKRVTDWPLKVTVSDHIAAGRTQSPRSP